MNINDVILRQNIIISLTGEQLSEFASQILSGAREIYENQKEPEQYLSRKQTSQRLETDLSSLWRWQQKGYLVPVRVGGKVRYKLSDINKILKSEAV